MFTTINRFQFMRGIVTAGLTLAGLTASDAPLFSGEVDAKKRRKRRRGKRRKKIKAPNIAITDITLEDHPDPGHNYAVAHVSNIGNRKASGFRIGMSAQRLDGQVRNEEFSLPLTLPKGGSTQVQFRLGCNWINGGAVTMRTDPSPVPGELANKIANNVLSESFGNVCS